ncbi:hypothetical protein [Rhizobium sp. 18055]|jgi:hypothetical protein|uniref:hypothetical protein n=1 Tax=Rhizobium sp. 18055 TaxID=2681403 RepID=UPI001356CBDA|nr:hypothetical protein [Rhizobium sp. 18055]
MPPRNRTPAAKSLKAVGPVIAQPAKKSAVALRSASPTEASPRDGDIAEQLAALRRDVEELGKTVATLGRTTRGGAIEAAWRAEATFRLYPVSALIAAGAVVAAIAFSVSAIRSRPANARDRPTLDDIKDLIAGLRNRA